MSTTTAPAPSVSILDGGGKSCQRTIVVVVRRRCDGMVCARGGATMVIHDIQASGMELSTMIVVCRKGHGRGIRFSHLLVRDDANFFGCGTVEHAANGLVVG